MVAALFNGSLVPLLAGCDCMRHCHSKNTNTLIILQSFHRTAIRQIERFYWSERFATFTMSVYINYMLLLRRIVIGFQKWKAPGHHLFFLNEIGQWICILIMRVLLIYIYIWLNDVLQFTAVAPHCVRFNDYRLPNDSGCRPLLHYKMPLWLPGNKHSDGDGRRTLCVRWRIRIPSEK